MATKTAGMQRLSLPPVQFFISMEFCLLRSRSMSIASPSVCCGDHKQRRSCLGLTQKISKPRFFFHTATPALLYNLFYRNLQTLIMSSSSSNVSPFARSKEHRGPPGLELPRIFGAVGHLLVPIVMYKVMYDGRLWSIFSKTVSNGGENLLICLRKGRHSTWPCAPCVALGGVLE